MRKKQRNAQYAIGRWSNYEKSTAYRVDGVKYWVLPDAAEILSMDNYLFKIHEVAKYIGTDIGTVRKWIREGKLEVIRLSHNVIRVRKKKADDFIKKYEEVS